MNTLSLTLFAQSPPDAQSANNSAAPVMPAPIANRFNPQPIPYITPANTPVSPNVSSILPLTSVLIESRFSILFFKFSVQSPPDAQSANNSDRPFTAAPTANCFKPKPIPNKTAARVPPAPRVSNILPLTSVLIERRVIRLLFKVIAQSSSVIHCPNATKD